MKGVREVADQVRQFNFLDKVLGIFDEDENQIEPGPNPFTPDKVLDLYPE